MQVFSLLSSFPYEGFELVGVFASRQDAESAARGHELFGDGHHSFHVVESALGESVSDVWALAACVE